MYLNTATGTNHSVQVAYKAAKGQVAAQVVVGGHDVSLGVDSALRINKDGTFFVVGGDAPAMNMPSTTVRFIKGNVKGETQVQVANEAWTVNVDSRYYPLRKKNSDKHRLDIAFLPKMNKLGKVAPHGLIGQSFDFDGIAVDGARDNYDDKEVTTKAMGEGAIEGTAKDYEIAGDEPYSADFKFTRWNLAEAAPRNISKLAGKQRSAVKLDMGMLVEL
jgi:hypothetical protein